MGMKNGWPIGVGYFAVAFALGIAAKKAGFTPWQAAGMSALIHASAGEYAGIMMVQMGAGYLETAVMELIANARYLLMSFSLSQKVDERAPLWQRLVMANYVTDEIFALSVARTGSLDPFYTFGVAAVASPGWVIGTFLGVVMGTVLPANVVSALSVSLFGMFLAIIIPPARKSRVLGVFIVLAMLCSYLGSVLPGVKQIGGGVRTIVLTVVLSLVAAVFFPHAEEESEVAP